MKTMRALSWTTAALCLLSLAACGKKPAAEPAAASPAPTSQAAAKAEPGEAYTRKVNAYTQAYNKLIGNNGLARTREGYFQKNMASRKPGDDLFINTGWIHLGLAALKQARALPAAGVDEMDRLADGLAASLDTLMTQLTELDVYYKSKAYKDDQLAKGKAQDPVVRASFDAAMAALASFNEALDREHKKRDEQELAALKAEGNMRMYNIKLGLQQGERIVSLFASEDDLANPGKFAQGDQLVAELEKTLAEQRKTNEAMGTKDANAMNHESLTEHLTALIGEYRQLRQSRKANDFNSMVHKYNAAVGAANSIGG